jgi:hypothetical protein
MERRVRRTDTIDTLRNTDLGRDLPTRPVARVLAEGDRTPCRPS